MTALHSAATQKALWSINLTLVEFCLRSIDLIDQLNMYFVLDKYLSIGDSCLSEFSCCHWFLESGFRRRGG
jgi:hypothetical protein